MELKEVVYVEDNYHNRRLVRRILESQGYAMIEAGDGEAGLRTIRDVKPPLVLLDIGLPKMDGLEVLDHIRTDERLCETPVIALTAAAMPGDRERFLEAGCDDYVAKPIKMRELLEKVAQYHGKQSTNTSRCA